MRTIVRNARRGATAVVNRDVILSAEKFKRVELEEWGSGFNHIP